MKPCEFCDQPSVGGTTPPLCAKHLDLAIISEFLRDRDEPVTPDTVAATLRRSFERGVRLALCEGDVEGLMEGEFAERYEIAEVAV